MEKKLLLVFIILALSDFTFAFQKKFTDHHWSVKAIEEINRTALHGLLLGTNEYDSNMTYKQYKKTSKYMTALYYTDKKEKHYLVISIIDEDRKQVLSSQLISVFNKPNQIIFDIESYQFLSKKTIFGLTIKTGMSSSVDFFTQEKLYIYSYDDSKMKILINGLQVYSKNSWRGGGCTSGYTKKNMKLSKIKYVKEYPQLIFTGELQRGKTNPMNKNLSNCFEAPIKNGKYKIILNYKNNKYNISKKIVYINNYIFKNIYQVSKAIRDYNIREIININHGIDIYKLKLGDEVFIPLNSRLY